MTRTLILVLGEIGRSPRMQYHARSLAEKLNHDVDFVGFSGAKPHPEVENNPKIKQHFIPQSIFNRFPRKLFILYAPFKVLFQLISLFYMLLFVVNKPDFILIQNPPAIPTLFVVQIVSRLRRAKLVIDWHNFGYTILALSLGKKHPFVRVSEWYEKFFGRHAHAHFCVSKGMQEVLSNQWGISATVVYDRPPDMFRSLSTQEKHETMMALKDCFAPIESKLSPLPPPPSTSTEHTLFTAKVTPSLMSTGMRRRANVSKDSVEDTSLETLMREDRPALIVSSTSWTADEDFGILLDAMKVCDQVMSSRPEEKRFKIVVVVTGRGPLKEHYESLMEVMDLKHCAISTAWLPANMYPKLLGCADLGVCLHYSSSGVDLPMKVVDMFGCGLPVCAINFPTLGELVQPGRTGMTFTTSNELASQIMTLLDGFPRCETLSRMRLSLRVFQGRRWNDEWSEKAAPAFNA